MGLFKKYPKGYKIIKKSSLFDKKWYVQMYHVKGNPYLHYLEKGWKLGYNPSADFDGNKYLLFNLDVAKNNINPLYHYEVFGKKEGRRIHKKNKKVVYTCIAGAYDSLLQHKYINNDYDYICFTDNQEWLNKKIIGHWEMKKVVEIENNAHFVNRWHKMHPHTLFSEYDESIYIDGNLLFLTDYIFKEIEAQDNSLLIPRHYKNSCIYEELGYILECGRDSQENIDKIKKLLEENNFPKKIGLCENNIIFRKHHDEKIIKIMEEWWNLVLNVCPRDQTSLMYVLWKNNYLDKLSTIENGKTNKLNFRFVSHAVRSITNIKRICLFAGYSKINKIEDYVVNYLKYLSLFADIYYLADCELPDKEIEKIKPYVKEAYSYRHEQYDFGSWKELTSKVGFEKMEEYDELIFANDSCYAPVFPFGKMFSVMQKKKVDFWGITENDMVISPHLQSYFIVFTKKVFSSDVFRGFVEGIGKAPEGIVDKKMIAKNYENTLTKILSSYGFLHSSYIPKGILANSNYKDLLLSESPFLKVKFLTTAKFCMENIALSLYFDFLQKNTIYDIELIKKHLPYADEAYLQDLDAKNRE